MSFPPIIPLPSSANRSPFTPFELRILAASWKAMIQNFALHTPPCCYFQYKVFVCSLQVSVCN